MLFDCLFLFPCPFGLCERDLHWFYSTSWFICDYLMVFKIPISFYCSKHYGSIIITSLFLFLDYAWAFLFGIFYFLYFIGVIFFLLLCVVLPIFFICLHPFTWYGGIYHCLISCHPLSWCVGHFNLRFFWIVHTLDFSVLQINFLCWISRIGVSIWFCARSYIDLSLGGFGLGFWPNEWLRRRHLLNVVFFK